MLNGKLNVDGTVELMLGTERVRLGALELDAVLQTLCALRVSMPERVPEQQEQIDTVFFNPVYSVRLDKEIKSCLLCLRHPGYGWINFEFPAQEILNMRTMWNHAVERLDLEPPVGYYDGPDRRRAKPH